MQESSHHRKGYTNAKQDNRSNGNIIVPVCPHVPMIGLPKKHAMSCGMLEGRGLEGEGTLKVIPFGTSRGFVSTERRQGAFEEVAKECI